MSAIDVRSNVPTTQTSPTSMRRSLQSDTSEISFKQWHKRMQTEHEILQRSGRPGFGLWKWCYRGCKPCRWFDSIEYDFKICKCCLTFKTFKSLGTILLICSFIYIFLFSILRKELLPGGTIFFMFVLFFAAYTAGYALEFVGLPSMFGNLLVGVIFGNVPRQWLPSFEEYFLEVVTHAFEKILLIIALVRAGLLLDISQIKNRVTFIIRISLLPLLCEFGFSWLASHYLIKLPWDWSALQGSILSIISLAGVTSIMQKNKQNGYGEDKNLSTVLIAAAALDVIFGIFLYVLCLSYIFVVDEQGEGPYFWGMFFNVLKQVLIGLFVGTIVGILAAFFPDKRNSQAAALRILVIGTAAFAIASILDEYAMPAAGVLGTLIMCLVASNMWEELGWHESSNPVQYFYTMAYYFGQPVALSLVGFSMNFRDSPISYIGLSIVVIIIGITGREIVCLFSSMGTVYPTNMKEKLFICIAWFSKGTFQALLAFAVEYMALDNREYLSDIMLLNYLNYSKSIKQTTILAILLTTPFVCYSLTLLSPVLLTKVEAAQSQNPRRSGPA